MLFAAVLLVCAAGASAQQVRVIINGAPTNLRVDWSLISAAPGAGNSFLAFLPVYQLRDWASFDPDTVMDLNFGAGNWLRCRMEATDWAYLSAQPCAHLAGNHAGVPYFAPLSLLTSSYDFGGYTGQFGQQNVPIPNSTLFGGNAASVLQGLENSWTIEHWELRTRGFLLDDLWNGCAGQATVTPNFSCWLAVRFEFTFQ